VSLIFNLKNRYKSININKLINYNIISCEISGLVPALKKWPYSSYRDYVGLRDGSFPSKKLILNLFPNREAFIKFSLETIPDIKDKYWI